jgi:hypothetical protein
MSTASDFCDFCGGKQVHLFIFFISAELQSLDFFYYHSITGDDIFLLHILF